MKKFSLLLSLALLFCMTIPSVRATSDVYQAVEVIHTEFGDFEVETTTLIYDSMARSNSRRADKIKTVKYDGNTIAEVTLTATFGFDSKTAWVISTSSSHTTYGGWSYGSETIARSGGKATLSAMLSNPQHRSIAVNISLTCSPTGQIS